MLGFNYKKAIQALNFFAIKEGGKISKLKALKLIWLADRAHIRKYGRPILGDRYYAMKFGPVPSNTKDLCSLNNEFLSDIELTLRDKYIKPSKDGKIIETICEVDKMVFSQTDIMVLEETYKKFGQYDQFYLAEKISHIYPEWNKWEYELTNNLGTRFEMDYEDFFNNPKNDKFFGEVGSELLEITLEMFKEYSHLANK